MTSWQNNFYCITNLKYNINFPDLQKRGWWKSYIGIKMHYAYGIYMYCMLLRQPSP